MPLRFRKSNSAAAAAAAGAAIAVSGMAAMAAEPETVEPLKEEPLDSTVSSQATGDVLMQDTQMAQAQIDASTDSLKQAQDDAAKAVEQQKAAQDAVDEQQKQLDEIQAAGDAVTEDLKNVPDVDNAAAAVDNAQDEADAAKETADAAKEDLELAEKELEVVEGQYNDNILHPKTEDDVQNAQEALDNAQVEVSKNEENVNSKQDGLNQADSAVSDAEKAHEEQQKVVDASQESVNQANQDLQKAQQDVKNAQQDVQQQESIKKGLETDSLQAEEALKQAMKDESSAQTALENAEKAVQDAKAAYDKAQQSDSAAELKVAKDSLDKAQAEYASSQKALEQAQKGFDAAEKAFLDADTAKKGTDSAQAEWQSKLDEASKKLTEAKAKEAQLAKEIETLKKNTIVLNEHSNTSLGFFESVGAQDAIKILNDAPSTTKLGDKDDATSLENMKETIKFLKQANELRKRHGLEELMVTDVLMAIAQVQCNASVDLGNHSNLYYVGENLTWVCDLGYTNVENVNNPFSRWYFQEKKLYDAGERDFSKVGHYLNIINEQYTTTGFAISTNGQIWENCFSQTFSAPYNTYGKGKTFTVDEYEQRFMAYYNQVKNAESNNKLLAEKQNTLTTATQARVEAETAVTSAQTGLSSAKDAANQAFWTWLSANETYETANDTLKAAQATSTKATGKLATAKDAYEKAELAVGSFAAYLQSLQDGIDNAVARQNNAQANYTAAQQATSDSKTHIQDLQSAIRTAEQSIEAARQKVLTLQNVVNEKEQLLKQANEKLESAEAGLNSAQNTYNDAVSKQKAAQDALAQAQAALESAQKDAAMKQMTLDVITDAVYHPEKLINRVTEARKVVQEKTAAYEKAIASLTDANSRLDAAKLSLAREELLASKVEFALSIWESVKAGNDVPLNLTDSEFLALSQVVDNYRTQAKKLKEAQEALAHAKSQATAKQTTLLAAQKRVQEAQDAYDEAARKLAAYIDSINNEDIMMIKDESSVEKLNIENAISKSSDLNTALSKTPSHADTAISSGIYVYVGGMMVSGAFALEMLRRKRKQGLL